MNLISLIKVTKYKNHVMAKRSNACSILRSVKLFKLNDLL